MNTQTTFIDNVIQPHCPWYSMYEKFGPANVKWCEERLCAWINEPLNAWSNLIYLIIGLYLIYLSKKHKNRFELPFGLVIFFMGAMSFVFHATNNFFTQILDFIGMFFFIYLLLTISLLKLKVISQKIVLPFYFSLIIASIGLIYLMRSMGLPYQSLILIGSFGILITQVMIYKKLKDRYPLKHLVSIIILFGIAVGFSYADVSRLWCTPESHFLQGHAIWHLFSGLGCWSAYKLFKTQSTELMSTFDSYTH